MQATIDRSVSHVSAASLKVRVARLLGTGVFVSLLVLLFITAVPYGTAEAWWKAFFVCCAFTLAIVWLVEGFLSESWISDGWSVILPLLVLVVFSILQTIPIQLAATKPGGITIAPWDAISADPLQTRFFAMQLLGLVLVAVFLFRYASSERRMRILINVVLAVAVASAIYGILRQTAQHGIGFGLPLIGRDQGYGQFINKNHFAFLMEMGLGLTLGLIFGGGIRREQMLIYLGALLPLWTGLALCNSRSGLIAMLVEVFAAAVLFGSVVGLRRRVGSESKFMHLTRSLPMRLFLLIVLISGVILGTLWLGGDRLATKLEHTRNELNVDASATREGVSRNEIWRVTLRMFAANPIVGVGMGAYWAAVPAFHDASGTLTPQEAHNDYLELLASGGLVGAAIGVWFAVALLRRVRQKLRSPNRFRRAACFGAAIGITGVTVHSLTDFGLHIIVNALVFTTLVVIATAKADWATPKAEEVA